MPLLWLSVAFLAGILLAAQVRLPGAAWMLLAAAALASLGWGGARWLILARSKGAASGRSSPPADEPPPDSTAANGLARLKLPAPLFALLAALALGAARYQVALPDLADPGFIAAYNDRNGGVEVEGVLVEPPDVRDRYANLRLRAERLRPLDSGGFVPVSGLVLARAKAGGGWQYGDRLRLRGRLETPPEDEEFSYRAYLARQGVHSYISFAAVERVGVKQGNPLLAAIYGLKGRALVMVYRLFPDPEASLLAGILLGVESGIPAEVKEAFQVTGTAHVIAISGFNISILGGLFAVLFLRLLGMRRRFLAVCLSLLAIGFYTLLVGAGASVVRAAIMGVLGLFAVQLGRRQDGLNSLAFAAALMALLTPFVLWDVSFQLSFMATLGLVLYADLLMQGIARLAARWLPAQSAQKLAKPAGEYLLFTLAALLTTLPVIVYHFQRLSISALVANPLILPAQPAVMVLGGLATALGLAYQPLGQAAAYLAWPFVAYTIRVVEWMAHIPGGAYLTGEISLGWVFLYYGALLFATFAGGRLRGAAALITPSLALAALGAVTVVIWQGALSAPDGRLHLAVLDVGGGEALLITTPGGRSVLINGGSSPSRLSDGLGRRLPLTRRRLDWLVVASPRDESIAALPRALERFPPDRVLWAGVAQDSTAEHALQAFFSARGIFPEVAQSGQVLDLGDGATLQVAQAGEAGAVLLLEWGSFRALLPAGTDEEMMDDLLDDPALTPVTALLLAEGGAAELNPPMWIEKLRPQVALLSIAGGYQSDPEVIAALEGYTLLRTDRNGWIELTADGEQVWVEVERK